MRHIDVLMIYDVQGWAWWNKIAQIKKNIPGEIRVDCARAGQYFRHEEYDFVVTFSPKILRYLKFVPPGKIILGCTSPLILDRLVQLIQKRRCFGGFVNSLEMYEAAAERKNLYCCQNGVDIDLFFPAVEPVRELAACWVGNSQSVHRKGLDLVQEACRLANVPLVYLDRQPLNKDACLLTPEQVRERIYHRSSFYICASEVDATPNSALEALACGLPVISTPVGNMLELIVDGYNGFLVERSAQRIASAIERLEKSDLKEMGENARRSVENNWSWSRQARKFEYMFNDLSEKQKHMKDKQALVNPAVEAAEFFQLAVHCEKQQDHESAAKWFRKAMECAQKKSMENMEHPDIYRIASAYKHLGEYAESETWFNKVLEISSDSNLRGGAYFHLGEMELQDKNREKARDFFERCLEMIPDHQKASEYLKELFRVY